MAKRLQTQIQGSARGSSSPWQHPLLPAQCPSSGPRRGRLAPSSWQLPAPPHLRFLPQPHTPFHTLHSARCPEPLVWTNHQLSMVPLAETVTPTPTAQGTVGQGGGPGASHAEGGSAQPQFRARGGQEAGFPIPDNATSFLVLFCNMLRHLISRSNSISY